MLACRNHVLTYIDSNCRLVNDKHTCVSHTPSEYGLSSFCSSVVCGSSKKKRQHNDSNAGRCASITNHTNCTQPPTLCLIEYSSLPYLTTTLFEGSQRQTHIRIVQISTCELEPLAHIPGSDSQNLAIVMQYNQCVTLHQSQATHFDAQACKSMFPATSES